MEVKIKGIKVFKILLCLLLATNTFTVYATDKLTVSTQLELREHWLPDRARMSNYMPVNISEVFNRYQGDVTFTMEFVVNSDGNPENFKLLSAQPAEAMKEAKFVKAYYMFLRYKPSKINSAAKPMQFSGNMRWWDPKRHKRR
jgi:hypothetical protein